MVNAQQLITYVCISNCLVKNFYKAWQDLLRRD